MTKRRERVRILERVAGVAVVERTYLRTGLTTYGTRWREPGRPWPVTRMLGPGKEGKRCAKIAAKELRRRLIARDFGGRDVLPNLTIGQFIAAEYWGWLRSRDVSKRTVEIYRIQIKHLHASGVLSMYLSAPPTDLSERHRLYRLGEGVKPQTINQELTTLGSVLRLAAEKGYRIGKGKIERFSARKVKRQTPEITSHMMCSILTAGREIMPPWAYAWLMWIAHVSMIRVNDVQALRVDQIDLMNRRARAWDEKNDRWREVPLAWPLVDFLRDYLPTHAEPVLGIRQHDAFLTWFRRAVERAGLPAGRNIAGGLTPHSCKHAITQRMVIMGVPGPTRRALDGHAQEAGAHGVYAQAHFSAMLAEVDRVFGRSGWFEGEERPRLELVK